MGPVAVALVLVLIVLAYDFWKRRRWTTGVDQSRLPPTACADDPAVFSRWFGHLPFMMRVMKEKDSHVLLPMERISRLTVDQPLVSVYVGPPALVRPMFVTSQARMAKILAAKGDSSALIAAVGCQMLGGRPVATQCTDPAQKKRHLSILSAALRRKNKLETLCQLTNWHVRASLDRLQQLQQDPVKPATADSSSTPPSCLRIEDARCFLIRLIVPVLHEMLCGVNIWTMEASDAEREQFFASHDVLFRYFADAIFAAVRPELLPFLHPIDYLKMRWHVKYLVKRFIRSAVDRRQQDIADGDDGGPDDSLAAMLDASAAGKSQQAFDSDTACAVTVSFVEPCDTVSGALQWVLFYLTQHADVQENCYKEIITVLGSTEPQEERPSFEDLSQMSFLAATMKETARVQPTARQIGRDNNQDMNVGDYTLPKGTLTAIFLGVIQSEEANFERADEFRPSRFHDDPRSGGAKEGTDTLSYSPFGYGQHRCFGEPVAVAMIKVILCRLLLSYKITLLSKPEEASASLPLFSFMPKKLVLGLVPRPAM